MRLLMKLLGLFTLILVLASCSQYESNLNSLGSQASYSDGTIPDDFPAPEDESPDNMPGDEIVIVPPEGEITPPPVQVNLKNTFFLEDREFSLARGPALRWDGCKTAKNSQGGYNSDSKCGRAYFHPSFADNLNDAFYICVSDAAKTVNIPQPAKVFIRHLGSYNDRTARNSSRISNHAYARAWDIVNFNLFDAQGKLYKISTLLRDYKEEQAVFYDEFRDCWRESLPSNCTPGRTEYKGSVGHTASKLGGNSLHNDHLHLSYPLCAGNS